MEAVPRLPMISFDMKASPDRPPTDFGKLKQYIRDFYNEDAETYSTEIHQLESLRATAVHPARDVTGCSVLKRYFCQLHFLQSRFPMSKDGAAAVNFTWRDTYASMVCSVADIRFEIVSILYNIGSLHSQLGASDNRASAEGLKLACSHFQCAAWAFQHLKDSYPQPAGVDVSPDVMQFMQQLCLAQAQECILEKSMTDNRKATINAKVAAQIVDYYNMALNALVHSGGSDDGSVLDTIGAKLFKSWKKYVKFKQTYYACISLLYQGMQSEEQQKMGERVAYYQAAFDKLTEASRLSSGLDQPEAVAETLAFTMDVVEGKRKGAKNDNEFIYHEKVPERDTLPDIKGASLVKGISFSVNDPDISGPDIFARLVPMKAHEASSLYSEEKAKLLRKVGAMLDEKDQELVGFTSSLQLEHLNAHLEPDIIPQELVDRCAALSAKPDAIQNLIDAMDRLSGLYHDVEAMLKEILELIKIEEAAEKEYQEVMGSRPPSIVATDLTREANKYKEAHGKAAESNETLHKAMAQHIANLRVLSLPLPELHKQLPSLSCLNLNDNGVVKELQHLASKVEEMRRQRSMLATHLRESVCSDDITSQLITRSSDNLQTVFTQELQKHSRYVSLIEQNLSAQDNILKALTDCYAEYTDTRKAITEILRQRTMMLSALMSSYDAYEDLIAKSNKGLEFYRKLETNVTKLLQRVKGTCKVQEEERETILIKNGKKLPSKMLLENKKEPKSTNLSSSSGLKLKDYLQNMKKENGVTYPTQPVVNQVPNQYNSSTLNYGNIQPPAAPSPQSYTDPLPGSDATQPWVPAIRPAPVGSEGTAPVCSNSAKLPDLKADISQNYPYQSSTNYPPYDPHYYYRSAQSPAVYNPNAYPSKPYQPSAATTGTNAYQPPNTAVDHSHALNTTQYSNVQSPFPPSYQPASNYTNPSNDPKYPSQYLPSTAYSTTQNPYSGPTYQQASTNSGYLQANTNTPGYNPYQAGSAGYQYPQQGYNSNSASPNHVVNEQSKGQNLQDPNSQSGTAAASNLPANTYGQQTSYATPTTQSAPYSAPNTYNQSQYPSYTSPASYMYSAGVGYQYGQNYQQPGTAPYNWQNAQGVQQPQNQLQQQLPQNQTLPQTQLQQNQQLPQNQQVQQTQQLSQNMPSQPSPQSQQLPQSQQQVTPNQLHQPQQPAPSINLEQKNWPQQNQYPYSYNNTFSTPVTNPNVPVTAGYPSLYNSTATSTPQPLSTTAASQYPPQSYYPNANYPQHLQFTPLSGVAHYTHAGQVDTSQTHSSQASVQGQTFAAQYNTNSAELPAVPTNLTYYSHQYGYQLPQYNSNNVATTPTADDCSSPQVASPTEQQGQVTPQSPMTYMQASNSNLTMTYSKQHVNGPRASDSSEEKKTSSNIDLLAGLDFSINETPLIPEQTVQTPAKVDNSNSAITSTLPRKEDIKIEEKMSSLTIETTTIPDVSVTTAVTPPVQEKQSIPVVSIPKSEDKTKLPAKDPYLDPEVLNQFATEVEKFEKFVDGITIKTLNGPTPLDIKWKELQDIQEKDSQKQSISVARCYPMKNRFPDILPYDCSRVELPSTKDDYINASHVKDISPHSPNFIVTQSPLPSTYADFWTMIIEQQVEIVVCLLNDMEIGENIYWPTVKGQEESVGRITMSLQSTNIRKHWVERIISVSNGRTARVIVHLQFTEWPGSSFPASPGPMLNLVGETLSVHNQQRASGPIVVHCVAGVGRAGLFLVTVAAVCDIQLGHGLPDLVKLAATISTYRKNSLHDREHLKFGFQTLLYYAQDLLMKRGILTSRSSFEEKRPKSHTRHPSQDFLLGTQKESSLQYDSEQNEQSGSSSNAEERKGSDPFHQIDSMWPIKRFQ